MISRAAQPDRAFNRYQAHGAIHFGENRSKAKEELIKAGRVPRRPRGGKSFAHSCPYPGRRARV